MIIIKETEPKFSPNTKSYIGYFGKDLTLDLAILNIFYLKFTGFMYLEDVRQNISYIYQWEFKNGESLNYGEISLRDSNSFSAEYFLTSDKDEYHNAVKPSIMRSRPYHGVYYLIVDIYSSPYKTPVSKERHFTSSKMLYAEEIRKICKI